MTYYHYTAYLYRQATRAWYGAVSSFGMASLFTIANVIWGPVLVFGSVGTAVPSLMLENLAAPGTPIEILLLMSIGIALDVMLWLGFMLYMFPMIAANSAHFKLAGDTSMKLVVTITENIPVNRMWDDVKDEVGEYARYVVRWGRQVKNAVEQYLGPLVDMATKWLSIQLAKRGPSVDLKRETIRRLVVNFVTSRIVEKTAYPLYIIEKHRYDCFAFKGGRPRFDKFPWNLAYIGGGTGCLEMVFGPTFLSTTVCLTWNPFIAFTEPTPLLDRLWKFAYTRMAAAVAWLMYTALRPVLLGSNLVAGLIGVMAVMGAFVLTIPLFIGASITVVSLKKRK